MEVEYPGIWKKLFCLYFFSFFYLDMCACNCKSHEKCEMRSKVTRVRLREVKQGERNCSAILFVYLFDPFLAPVSAFIITASSMHADILFSACSLRVHVGLYISRSYLFHKFS